MGALGDVAIAALLRSAGDPDARVRESAMVGFAKVRSDAAFAALAPFVLDTRDEARQLAAVRALPVLASKWAWQARGDLATGQRLRTKARALVATVERSASTSAVVRALDDVEARLR